MPPKIVFISYSWDDEDHKIWVEELATKLRTDGVDVRLDQWSTALGDQLPKFMEQSITQSDFVLVICTPNYKIKSENRQGGVGYEGDIITSDVFINQNRRKYIPILRKGDWATDIPVWLSGSLGVDLKSDNVGEYQKLVTHIKGEQSTPPPIVNTIISSNEAKQTALIDAQTPSSTSDDIKIIGIILEEITTPTMDGTRGSALYKVPFRLSKRPPADWGEIFVHYWNRPPSYTSMHRPSIASVVGNKVILDGTTIEEVEQYHLSTLKLALGETNKKYHELRERRAKAEKAKYDREQKFRNNLNDAASRLDFDD